MRPALLTSFLCYCSPGLVVADVGRPWNFWNMPLLLALEPRLGRCSRSRSRMAYFFVLWIELAPALLERLWDGEVRALARLRPHGSRASQDLPFVIALGMLLPTMHQSSLGLLMVLAGHEVHPLWQTAAPAAALPGPCLVMGFGAVIVAVTPHASSGGARST